MNFGQAIQSGFKNYVGFTGRARRSEFWWWILFQFLVGFAAVVLNGGRPALLSLVSLALLLPSLALEVRRLHDVNRSGWWVLIGFVPIVGIILLIVWWCSDGASGANAYGSDPKLRPDPSGAKLGGTVPPSNPGFGAAGQGGSDAYGRLEQLGRLRDQGVLTAAEFEAEKAKLIGGRP